MAATTAAGTTTERTATHGGWVRLTVTDRLRRVEAQRPRPTRRTRSHERHARRLVAHELGAEGAADRLELRLHLRAQRLGALLERAQALAHPLELVLELEHPLDAGQVHARARRSAPGSGAGGRRRSCEYRRVPLGERFGVISPRVLVHAQRLRVHRRQLGGDGDHEDALLRASGGAFRSPPSSRRAAASARGSPFMTLREPVERLLLLGREVLRHVDHEAVVDVAAAAAAERLRALAAQALDGAVLGPARARAASWCRAASAPRRRRRGSPR